jgi:hypothetical protein
VNTSDPFGRALKDHYQGTRTDPLVQRDGAETLEHPIEAFYFGSFDPEEPNRAWIADWLAAPLVDLGAGVGRDALYFQQRGETVALEVSDHLVDVMRDRGVTDARRGDMFSLREQFDRDRFQSALAYGTQVGLAGSVQGLRRFLGDLSFVTTPDATAVIDGYDPAGAADVDLLGYRPDPARGLASRVFHFEYEGDVGETLLFRLFSPDRLREATVGTGWSVADISYQSGDDPVYYRAALAKR